jgi:hypothetical protein
MGEDEPVLVRPVVDREYEPGPLGRLHQIEEGIFGHLLHHLEEFEGKHTP